MKNKIIASSFWDYLSIVTATIISLVLQVGMTTFSTRILGANGYGKLALFFLVAQLILLFGISWTSAAVIRYGREEFVLTGGISKTFWGRNVILLPTLVVFFIIVFLFKGCIVKYVQLPRMGFYLLILYILGNLLSNYVQYIQQAVDQMRMLALSKILQRLISLLGLAMIMFLPFVSKDISSVLIVAIISLFSSAVFFTLPFKIKYFLPVIFDKAYIKKIFLFSYPVIFGSGSAYIIDYIDIIVIKKYMRLSDVGVYSLSYQGFSALQAISMSLITILGPMLVTFLAEGREDLIKRFINRIIMQGSVFWSIFLSIIIFLGSVLIPFVFGRSFQGSVVPFSILMVGLGFNVLGCFYSPVLTAYELIRQSMVVNVIMALINLAGDFILVPYMGIAGAALASSIAFSVSALCYVSISNKYLSLNEWRQVFSMVPLITMLVVSLLFKSLFIKGASLILILMLSYLIIKKTTIFQEEDVTIFEKVKMPSIARSLITKTYAFLSA